ncbi:MAG: chemotaxis family two-component system response regulator Rcp1 [Candidatus Latescibacterota bacterium]|jgi:chemotaxis family two-component system response regulator Rcp1
MTQEPPLKTIRILLVDDNEDDVLLTKEAFKEANITSEFLVAQDGVEALSTLRQPNIKQPDMILLDLNMPRKNGRETLAELKNDPLLKRIPVVVLTTSSSEDDINSAYDLHANSFITKPTDFDVFVNTVKNLTSFWFETAQRPNVL